MVPLGAVNGAAKWSDPGIRGGEERSRRGKQQGLKTGACLVHLRKSEEATGAGVNEGKDKR